MSELLPFLQTIRLEQVEFLISDSILKKLILQLTRQVEHKEVILTLFKLILKGTPCFMEFVKG